MTTAWLAGLCVADSVPKAAHLHVPQVTAAALQVLQKQTFSTYKENQPAKQMDFTVCCNRMAVKKSKFHYWVSVQDLKLPALGLFSVTRDASFQAPRELLLPILFWIIAQDHFIAPEFKSVTWGQVSRFLNWICGKVFCIKVVCESLLCNGLQPGSRLITVLVKGEGWWHHPSPTWWMVVRPKVTHWFRILTGHIPLNPGTMGLLKGIRGKLPEISKTRLQQWMHVGI